MHMAVNRPRGRQKHVTGNGSPIKRRGSGLGTGPVGGAGRSNGIGGGFSHNRPNTGNPNTFGTNMFVPKVFGLPVLGRLWEKPPPMPLLRPAPPTGPVPKPLPRRLMGDPFPVTCF